MIGCIFRIFNIDLSINEEITLLFIKDAEDQSAPNRKFDNNFNLLNLLPKLKSKHINYQSNNP